MGSIKITDDIYYVGVNDRETTLFENIWPLPEGVAYNSYLVVDDKIALIDTVKGAYQNDFIENIKSIIGSRKIDYLIINHMEPDHSGSIGVIKEYYPDIKIVGNSKTKNILCEFNISSCNFEEIFEGDAINIGKHRLEFSMIPMVHWPETMITYDVTDCVLFSGDAFGAFGTLNGGIFDDEFDIAEKQDEYLRYYSNIVGKFSTQVQSALDKLSPLLIRTICSTHGPIVRNNPDEVIDWYRNWSSHQTEEGVVVAYASMYGNTKKIADYITRKLSEKGVRKIKVYDVSKTHMSFVERDIWRYKAAIFGSCTYNNKLFPLMELLISHMENAGMKNRIMGIFGTYTWAGGAVNRLREFSNSGSWQLIEPAVEVKCSPTEEDYAKADQLVDAIYSNL